MKRYFATFPAGCYELIVKSLKSFKLDEFKIIEHDDSSVVFNSVLSTEKLIEIRYFTNIYAVIENSKDLSKSLLNGSYFLLMGNKEGASFAIDEPERIKLEERIKKDFGLKLNTHLSKNNFYLIERKSGIKLFTLRLSRAKFKRDTLKAGELRPELAHILCLTAGVKAKNTVLDMFAGYGAIPYEAVRGFGCKKVIAVDTKLVSERHEHPFIKWHQGDAENITFILDESIDRIVTDPPWGVYAHEINDLDSLYTNSIKEMERILKHDGVAVVLTGYAGMLECLKQFKKLQLIGNWNILVSGKKATIHKLKKTR